MENLYVIHKGSSVTIEKINNLAFFKQEENTTKFNILKHNGFVIIMEGVFVINMDRTSDDVVFNQLKQAVIKNKLMAFLDE